MVKKLITLILLAISLYTPPSTTQAQGDSKTWLLSQINALRGQLGLHAYVLNGALGAAAQQHSEYMAATGDVSHTQSNGSTPASRAAANGYMGKFVSENIYGGSIATAADAWGFWVNSSVHYAGLTHSRNNEIGIGVAVGEYGTFFTLVFGYGTGVDAPPAPVPPDNPAPNPPAPQPPPATRRPPPPTQTFTPSPTIPTFTPTVTWTFTPTWTPTASATLPPATQVPIVLPTAAVVVAQAIDSPAPTIDDGANAPTTPPAQQFVDDNDDIRDVLPYLLIGQVILLGIGVVSLAIRKK